MTDHVGQNTPSSQKKGNTKNKKKLHKQELRMRERLQEAQQAQLEAARRAERAQARLQKRNARVRRIEHRLLAIQQQLGIFPASQNTGHLEQPASQNESVAQPEISTETQSVPSAIPTETKNFQPEIPTETQLIASVAPNNEADTGLEATSNLQTPLLQAPADAINRVPTPAGDDDQGNVLKPISESAIPEETENSQSEAPNVEARAVAEVVEQSIRLAAERVPHTTPSPEEIVQVAQIEEEEEAVEMVTSMMIADVTALAAAQAEAAAEASRARTVEAQRMVQQAEHILDQVRAAIRNGILANEEAAFALQDAEHEVTRTHAALADAEAAEERAAQAAINAEAEAEVAEGMAFAIEDRAEHGESIRNLNDEVLYANGHRERQDDDDDTLELPIIHSQE